MRRKLVIGNWKMNFTTVQAREVISEFLKTWEFSDLVRVGFAPTYLSIATVKECLGSDSIWTGAQDCFWKESGAFTSCISAPMLADIGANFCLVGHSERRGRFGKLEIPHSTLSYFGETNETVNLKAKALLDQGITAVICVGETLTEREGNHTESVIASQIEESLIGIDQESAALVSFAYEPVWAIGTGKVCDPGEANRICGFIRSIVESQFGSDVASEMRILYGGSVKESNAGELFKQEHIDGGLVGGASLDPVEFGQIVKLAAAV